MKLSDIRATLEAEPVNEAVVDRIRKLQWLQLQHDREYHADIFCLTPAEKLTHFVLHLNKYTPKLMRVQNEVFMDPNKALDYQNILTDFGVILLSMANVFNIRLGQYSAERVIEDIDQLGEEAISMAFYRRQFGGATPTNVSLFHATTALMVAAGEAADVLIKHARLEGNIRNSMTNLIHAMWDSFQVASHVLAYAHDGIRCKHFDEHIFDRIVFIESKNPNYATRPKYAEDFAPVA